jgi:hypothetical protein
VISSGNAKHEYYVTLGTAFVTDIKLSIEDLLLALESTFDKFYFVNGTASEFHFN